jgi:hypothetical protein
MESATEGGLGGSCQVVGNDPEKRSTTENTDGHGKGKIAMDFHLPCISADSVVNRRSVGPQSVDAQPVGSSVWVGTTQSLTSLSRSLERWILIE